MARWARGRPVVDAGCGVGGNAIAFAREGCPVVALERDAERLAMARHNAKVYGVAGRVRFVQGDALALAPEHGGPDTLLFVDPPWGREGARARRELADLPPVAELAAIAKDRYAALWAKLPPSATPAELLAGGGEVRALFGEAEGDYRRIKFLLASTAGFS
nr:trimethylguanosine synthase [Pseudenhygromyxa sp. WMMC2535]